MSDRNIILHLSYDGSAYHGWQTQKQDCTVQETLEKALSKICGHRVKAVGCGRTDAGVHALHYCANFRTASSIPAERIPFAVNALLPRDIAVISAKDGPEEFNAIGSCIKKEYIYRILNAPAFEGTHDFRAVRSVGTETKTTVRTVYHCCVERNGETITISICANGFLYNMCRAMVGTMVYASYGKLRPEDIPKLLEKGDRRLTGPTMPPQGFSSNTVSMSCFLLVVSMRVFYPISAAIASVQTSYVGSVLV